MEVKNLKVQRKLPWIRNRCPLMSSWDTFLLHWMNFEWKHNKRILKCNMWHINSEMVKVLKLQCKIVLNLGKKGRRAVIFKKGLLWKIGTHIGWSQKIFCISLFSSFLSVEIWYLSPPPRNWSINFAFFSSTNLRISRFFVRVDCWISHLFLATALMTYVTIF